jgi:hypothetical protein
LCQSIGAKRKEILSAEKKQFVLGACQGFRDNPNEERLTDVYLMERLGTKQGWSNPAPDE